MASRKCVSHKQHSSKFVLQYTRFVCGKLLFERKALAVYEDTVAVDLNR